MMLVTLVATLCMIAHPEICNEERFDVPFSACMVTAQEGLSDFIMNDPRYGEGWMVAGWACYLGNPPPKKVPA